jgi:hypothetical protein
MTWLLLASVSWNYMLTTEVSMPHLEDNLRYAITHETRCLTRDELLTAFSVLQHPSLSGCALRPSGETTYDLVCRPGSGTTGEAHWDVEPGHLYGTLHVRLGGKNMTFSQRITAVPLARCNL